MSRITPEILSYARKMIAREVRRRGIARTLDEYEDLICWGLVGLVEAERSWDGKSCSLVTYAWRRMLGYITTGSARAHGYSNRRGRKFKAHLESGEPNHEVYGVDSAIDLAESEARSPQQWSEASSVLGRLSRRQRMMVATILRGGRMGDYSASSSHCSTIFRETIAKIESLHDL